MQSIMVNTGSLIRDFFKNCSCSKIVSCYATKQRNKLQYCQQDGMNVPKSNIQVKEEEVVDTKGLKLTELRSTILCSKNASTRNNVAVTNDSQTKGIKLIKLYNKK